MKKKVIIFSVLGAVLLTMLILVALLPRIVSSDRMRPFVLRTINQQIPGDLQINSWSLHWFGGLLVKGIVYDNRQDDLLVRAAEFKTDSGILGLIAGRGDWGAVEIQEPAVFIYTGEKSRPRKPKGTPPPGPAAESKPDKSSQPHLPNFCGRFRVTNGSLHSVAANGSEKVIADNLNVLLTIPGPPAPINYQFSVKSGDRSGQATGEGILNLAADDPLNLQKIVSNSKLSIDNWELEDVSAILASRAAIPAAKGRLNAKLLLAGSAAEGLQVLGDLSIPQLKLHGGPLGTDTPAVKGISVRLDAGGNTTAASLKKLVFQSSLASGAADGTYDAKGHHRLFGQVDINLAELFSQIPGTLNLRQGTKITQGNMTISARLDATEQAASFEGDARVDRITGVSSKNKLSWDQPVTLSAKGALGPDGLQLDNFSLRSAFLNADGRGDLGNMKVKLAADLEAALKELKKFVAMEQWDGRGTIDLKLDLKEKSKAVSQAVLNLDVKNLVLNRNREPILPKQEVRADFTTDLEIGPTLGTVKLSRPQAKITSTLAAGNFSAAGLAWNASTGLPDATDMKLDANLNLQQLSSILTNLKILTTQNRLEGQSLIKSGGTLNKGVLALDSTTLDIKNFVYRQDKKIIKDDRLHLATKGKLDFNARSVLLSPCDMNTQAGTIHLPELKIADWADARKDMKTGGTADLDLAKLASGYSDFMQLPPATQISGRGRFDIDVDFSNPNAQYLKLRGQLTPFNLAAPTLPTISENKVSLDADIKRSPDGKQLTIENFKINSNALTLAADGKLDQSGKNKIFEAKGTMAPDLRLVSEYLKKTGKGPIEIEGQKTTPFTIRLVSKGDRWEDPLQHLNFSGGLYVDSVKAYGLTLAPKDVPIRLVDAAVDAKLESPANGGLLAMQPIVDMRTKPYVLSFKENIDILKEVKVTQGLVDGLLANLHPLFKNAVMPEGILGLHLKNFKWPLAEKGLDKASFAGTLRLNGIRLQSTPFLAGLLDMIGVSEREIMINDQSIEFEARQGRIACSPVTLDIGGYPLKMEGSAGFDHTLDFIAQVPITPKIVGKDAYQILQGTTIKVPIRGTVSKPNIDQAAFQEAAGDLMQQVLQKNVHQGVQNLLKNLFKK